MGCIRKRRVRERSIGLRALARGDEEEERSGVAEKQAENR